MLEVLVRQTDRSALSGLPAPRFWPTSVAAALLMPQDGSIANTMILIASVLAAAAALPKLAMIRTTPIQAHIWTMY